jgi:hypothetical protein
MNWLIAGGSGRIGAALTDILLPDGHQVTILSRQPDRPRSRFRAEVSIQHWDGRTLGDWAGQIGQADVVVNLAGEKLAGPNPFSMRWTAARKQRLCMSRKWAGEALAAAIAAAARKPKVFIQSSGIDYYPIQDQIATEETPPGEDFLSNICAECWEPSTAEVEQIGVRRAVLRIGPTLSLILPPLALQSRMFLGGPLGSGKQWVSWVHLEDVIRTIIFLVETESASGPFNLCAPNPVTNAEFSKILGKVQHRPSLLPTPAFMMRLAFGEMADTLLLGVRAAPVRLLELGFEFRYPQLEPALRNMLGFS